MKLQQLVNDNVNGATFVAVNTTTVPTVRKTIDTPDGRQPNPHFGRVEKHTDGMNVMVFQNKTTNGYENMVNRRLAKEGKDPSSFELGPRKWGTRLPNQPFVEHKGVLYLEVIVLAAGNTYYTLDGQRVSKDDIQGLSAGSSPDQGGLEDKVILRTFKADSVKEITIGKETHTL